MFKDENIDVSAWPRIVGPHNKNFLNGAELLPRYLIDSKNFYNRMHSSFGASGLLSHCYPAALMVYELAFWHEVYSILCDLADEDRHLATFKPRVRRNRREAERRQEDGWCSLVDVSLWSTKPTREIEYED